MLTLVVERSTRRPGWALFRDAVCQLEAVVDGEPARAPEWLAHLGEALDAAGVSLAQIDRFAAGLGPGSFSGTRAAAQDAYATQHPVVLRWTQVRQGSANVVQT